jgi:hypothetical protein
MSNPIPPPLNEGSNCPNCGAFRPAGQTYCANCGYGQPRPASGGGNPLLPLWIVLFVIIGLPAGCLGGCFLLMTGTAGYSSSRVDFVVPLLIGLAGVAIFVGLLVALIKSARKKP